MSSPFVHLHVHTEYSILDGASRLDELIDAAVADGQPALGITDHGNMYGVLDFYKKCKQAGIKPVIGTEAYMARDSRYERPNRRGKIDDTGGDTEGGGKLYYHITLLAMDNVGYKNLIQIASRAFLEGYYYKPRCDWEILSQHSKGVVATTGCLGGQVPQALLQGRTQEALERAARFQEIFGRENFFVELQNHGIPEQERIEPDLLDIARQINAPLLATNDSHYTHRHDAEAHDALLCVQTASHIHDTDRFKFHGDEFYLKTSQEMRHVFKDVEAACDNTLWVAERSEVEIEFGKPQLPHFPVPESFCSDRAYLEHLTLECAKKRWAHPISAHTLNRLEYELEVINSMGFASYFLIVWDLVLYARKRGIRVGPGRGSAAGCAVAYALGITDLDPIKHDLLFERFLNPARVSMPDIDLDFDSRFRDELINYVADRYGRDHVAQIITFGTIKARAAVRDAARVLGHPVSMGDKISKAIPPMILGRDTPLRYYFEKSEKYKDGYAMAADLRDMVANDSDVAKVVEVAQGLEGLRRQDGIHAAAVVITREPITELVPIQRKPESGTDPELAPVVTQYEMHGMEELGLLKMDFLGLRNLDVITDCVKLVQSTRGENVDIDNVDLEDHRTYELLSKGDTIGVFQLESPQMRALMRSLAPTDFNDVAALVALYRPGPMAANMHNDYADRKNKRKPVEFFHADAEEVLADTYGLMIYQENVMRVAQQFAGYSLAEADSLRKAMGKKIRSAMAKEKEKFVTGVAGKGYQIELGQKLFGVIEQFADYAFNKSHSYGYGLIAYQTAYLKANFPVEYFAALLTSVRKKQETVALYLHECRVHNIEVRVPDVNLSAEEFTPFPHSATPVSTSHPATSVSASHSKESSDFIIYGLSAVRNMSKAFAECVVRERQANGVYTSFADLIYRIDTSVINKRVLEFMIKAGAFDSFGYSRKGLLNVYEQIIDVVLRKREEREMGVMSLFDTGDHVDGDNNTAHASSDLMLNVPDQEYDRMKLLALEKEALGLYVSGHPMSGLEDVVSRRSDAKISAMKSAPDDAYFSIGGVITDLVKRHTRKGDLMASFSLEDITDSIEVVVFPKTMEEHGAKLEDDAVVVVNGRVMHTGDHTRFVAHKIYVLNRYESNGKPTPLRIKVTSLYHTDEYVERIKNVLTQHPGDTPVQLHLELSHRVAKLPKKFTVNTERGVVGELKALLGGNAIVS